MISGDLSMNFWKGLGYESMGKINMKLMQGIEATEKQIQTQKHDKMSQRVAEKDETGKMYESHQMPQIAQKQLKPSKTTRKGKKTEDKPNTKSQKQVFSFRAAVSDISIWKSYGTASGKTMENIGTAAMNEYMKRHKLTGAEMAVFEALMAREGKRG